MKPVDPAMCQKLLGQLLMPTLGGEDKLRHAYYLVKKLPWLPSTL